MVKKLSILGFRGFGIEQTINFSLPNGCTGSGLTFIVGANNSGKTTISEAIKSFNGGNSPSFSEGKRSVITNGFIKLSITLDNDMICEIKTLSSGGSETTKEPNNVTQVIYSLPARRFIEHEFGDGKYDRKNFINNNILTANRGPSENSLVYRLQRANKEKYDEFNSLLKRILGKNINWTIEKKDSGNYYIKYTFGPSSHSAEGVGDGILSIFAICDALYDSGENSSIYIDEPELSLHPSLQNRLMDLLRDLSANRQIIVNTHSPYFVDWESIFNGASLIRVYKDLNDNNCRVASLDHDTISDLNRLISAIDNPHILGLNSNEVFFLEDDVILTEGQDDVRILKKITVDLGTSINGSFFGWGSGGAENISKLMSLFKKLQYKRVVAIFDNDKKIIAEQLASQYPEYKVIILETNDIRDKKAVRQKPAKIGLTNSKGTIKNEYISYMQNIIIDINSYLLEE